MDTVNIKDRQGLIRDLHSKAVINSDTKSYQSYKERILKSKLDEEWKTGLNEKIEGLERTIKLILETLSRSK
jgi:hypothetical protein